MKRFLAEGPAPVYMTFGSMIAADPHPREITALLVEAARLAGCRAIIQSRWDRVGDIRLGPGILPLTHIPHRRVFLHCAAVVHQGGSGTTQAATAAGCPSVVVEHATDQPLWGSVLHRAGIAPRMLHRRTLTPRSLAEAIKKTLGNPHMAERAKQIAARMQNENGVAQAVKLIESV